MTVYRNSESLLATVAESEPSSPSCRRVVGARVGAMTTGEGLPMVGTMRGLLRESMHPKHRHRRGKARKRRV